MPRTHTHPPAPQAAVLSLMLPSEREHGAVTCADGSAVCVHEKDANSLRDGINPFSEILDVGRHVQKWDEGDAICLWAK
jgi:hypothetical protein